ncbi:hypothetical protein B0H19DRAFT_1067900 [Mycena capillaripes]|nr:hypothetical protein B0H19DRAFT_1067900 [Mycena capillaripes]
MACPHLPPLLHPSLQRLSKAPLARPKWRAASAVPAAAPSPRTSQRSAAETTKISPMHCCLKAVGTTTTRMCQLAEDPYGTSPRPSLSKSEIERENNIARNKILMSGLGLACGAKKLVWGGMMAPLGTKRKAKGGGRKTKKAKRSDDKSDEEEDKLKDDKDGDKDGNGSINENPMQPHPTRPARVTNKPATAPKE